MKTILAIISAFLLAASCSSVPEPDADCPPPGTRDPFSGLPVGKDCCDVPTLDDNSNCGACGVVCTGEHASMDCDLGACIVDQCEPGWADSDKDPVTGCEARTCVDVAAGTICGGDGDAGIHGECNANGVCEWTDWSCDGGSCN